MPQYRFVVQSGPTAGMEDEYNDWYDKQHLVDVCAVPGVTGAYRAKLLQSKKADTPAYIAIYEIESDDADAVLAEIGARAGTDRMPMSPAIDKAGIVTSLYEVRPGAAA